ncbi:MAG TPA: hypothetical protein VFX96_03200 [Pyrinomonadaceae bacterium]|nr:hypothetical protein [Pyrinomonadaceae bacterium]
MSRKLKLIILVALVALTALVLLNFNRSQRVDMTAYVPAESLVYVEVNSLPDIFNGVVTTDAWKRLAPAAGISSDVSRFGWLSNVAYWTGVGSAETVVLSRAQMAFVVLGFQASEEADASLKITPRAALVAETHTGEGRTRPLVERWAGDLAARLFGTTQVERKETGGATVVVWTSQENPRRKVVAGVYGTVAVVGNDETAVLACLAARKGERESLAGNARLRESRGRVGGADALAFGYAPAGSAAKVLESTAPLYVEQISEDPKTQSILASVVPRLADRLLRSAAWGARVRDGAFEDRYLLELPEGVSTRLGASLTTASETTDGATALLPSDVYQVSRYSYADPAAAWGGLRAAVSSQVDTLHAPLVGLALESLLKPYGIEEPREFLSAAGGEIVTARLDGESESKVLIVRARDTEALRAQVRKRLGAGAREETSGGQQLFVSQDADGGAASFVGDYLVMGSEEDVRRCLDARTQGSTLDKATPYASARARAGDAPAQVLTMTSDAEYAADFVNYFAPRRGGARDEEALRKALAELPYSVTETRLGETGFEKRTSSSFGLLGEIITRYAPVR